MSLRTLYSSAFLGRRFHTCIPNSALCDGVSDCKYGDDEVEENCIRVNKQSDCDEKEFYCKKSNKCATRCNGEIECEHAEDEIDCPNLDHECKPGSNFRCLGTPIGSPMSSFNRAPSYCIPDHWACDGQVDCHPSQGLKTKKSVIII